jgi:hypothetical protein
MCDACSQGIPFTNDEVSGHDVNGDGPITEPFPAGDECPATLRPEELQEAKSARYMRVADLRREKAIEELIDEDTDRSCPDPDGWFV